ncbi:putative two-component sensor kinase [Bifidobacterium stellenboschense]|uniref:Putative two-component sensor kinase n=2 Tax=Bifidobacterium stellenboschense TaxID=762211 RepID=A0A087DPI8_9BIFI|nr:putative two-component sensor kinase [Bifidobacterium stellenboschense]
MWCVVLLSAGLTVLEMVEYPARLVATTTLTVMHILCLLALPFRPLPLSVAVAVTYVACAFLPDMGGASLFYGMWVALAAIGRYGRSRWWGLLPPSIAAVRWMVAARAGIPFGDYVILLVSFFVVYAFGRAMSWRAVAVQAERDRLRYERERDRLEAMRRDARAASRIHDAVTNDLAYMAMRLDYERSRATDDEHTELFDELYRHTIGTLGEVRTVIDMLDGDDGDGTGVEDDDGRAGQCNDSDSAAATFPARVRDVLGRNDRLLARLGFTGDSTMIDDLPEDESTDADDATRERETALIGLLRELYTNIAVHGDPAGAYRVVVRRNDDGLSADQVNDIARHPLLPDKPRSGKGLALHRARFDALGGSIVTSAEDGTWILHAVLPSRRP